MSDFEFPAIKNLMCLAPVPDEDIQIPYAPLSPLFPLENNDYDQLQRSRERHLNLIRGEKPWIIAHRAGNRNWPENTIEGFQRAKAAGVDAIEIDVQVTKDGVPVVYHPGNLKKWTNGNGSVGQKNLEDLESLNASWNYKVNPLYAYSHPDLRIPTLVEVLQTITDIPLILDLKSMPAEPLIQGLIDYIPEKEWKRLIIYSTNKEHTDLLKKMKPDAMVFEDRDITRARLLEFLGSGNCSYPSDSSWVGFELVRKMTVTEKFALGESSNDIKFHLWNQATVDCFRETAPEAMIVFFGINTAVDFSKVIELGADAVYTDDPVRLLKIREQMHGNMSK